MHKLHPLVRRRLAMEKRIARSLAKEFIAHGFAISVHDGEEWAIVRSKKYQDVLRTMFQTDMDEWVIRNKVGMRVGWCQFVYGNDGFDVLSDYSVALEPYMIETQKLIDKLGGH